MKTRVFLLTLEAQVLLTVISFVPTFIIEENAVFQIDVRENKGLRFSLPKCTIPEFSAWTLSLGSVFHGVFTY